MQVEGETVRLFAVRMEWKEASIESNVQLQVMSLRDTDSSNPFYEFNSYFPKTRLTHIYTPTVTANSIPPIFPIEISNPLSPAPSQ